MGSLPVNEGFKTIFVWAGVWLTGNGTEETVESFRGIEIDRCTDRKMPQNELERKGKKEIVEKLEEENKYKKG